jgi:predicted HicB family RNase H-like nuclease
MKLTSNQKRYRLRKQRSKREFRRIKKADGKVSTVVTRIQTNLRISTESYKKLKSQSDAENISIAALLNRLIQVALPSYRTMTAGSADPMQIYSWNESLFDQKHRRQRKDKQPTKRVVVDLTSTSHKTLKAHAAQTKRSMARVVDELLRHHKFLTPEQRQRQADQRARMKNYVWTPPTPLSAEEQEEFNIRYQEFLARRNEELKLFEGTGLFLTLPSNRWNPD